MNVTASGCARSSECEHAVQDADSEGDLRAASAVRAWARPVPDHALEPAEVGFDQCALMVT